MSLAVLQASVLQTNGALSIGAAAQITVRTPTGALATLYTDRAGAAPAGNPVTADSAGFFRVYTTPGRYNITVTTVSGSQQYNDVVIEAEAEAKRNIAATDPAVTNDETEGYSEWSLWANSATSEVFRCISATTGAAVWVKTTLTIDELGTAALEDVGTTIGDVVQLEDVGGVVGLPAVDGSQLTGVTTGSNVTIATITPATDANITLTLAQYTADVLVIETGAWTTAREIIVPDESRSWQVISNSAHAATVKTALGAGVTVPAGQSRPLVCNGTNVVDPLTPRESYGMLWTNNTTDATNDFDVSDGGMLSDDKSTWLYLPTAQTKRMDAAWASGNNAGALATGAAAFGAGVSYHVFVGIISGSVEIIVDSDPGAANAIANNGLGAKRRIFSFLTSTGPALPVLHTSLVGNDVRAVLDVIANDVNDTGSTTGALATLSVPTGISVIATVLYHVSATITATGILTETRQTNTAPTLTQYDAIASTGADIQNIEAVRLTDTSGQIRYRNSATLASHRISTKSYIVPRSL